jgi:hypothetical protein
VKLRKFHPWFISGTKDDSRAPETEVTDVDHVQAISKVTLQCPTETGFLVLGRSLSCMLI